MWPFSQWTTAGRAALTYITIGALTGVWAGVWYVYLFNNPHTESAYYWCIGFLVTGLAIFVIGLSLGIISRAARNAEVPAGGAPAAVASPHPNATPAPTAVLAPLNLASALAAPNGEVALAQPPQPIAEITGASR